MLPPTMMTAPTSALARPKPASSAVSRLKRPSHSSVGMARQARGAERAQMVLVFGPEILHDLPRQRDDDRRDQHGLRDDHGRRA